MAKKNMIDDYEDEFEEDLDYDEPEDHAIAEMMGDMVQASHQHAMIAVELTKLVVSKNPDATMSENKIFDIYKKAAQLIVESSPLRFMLEKQ